MPPLPDDATPEQKDEHWYKHYYQKRQGMAQLTVRAVLMGGILGMLMAASNLYTTLAIGWAFGVAITACVMSYVIWNGVRAFTGSSEMTILENNCMQSTASAAGYSTGSTMATMFGAMLLLFEVPEGKSPFDIASWDVTQWWVAGSFTLLTGLLGTFLAIPLKRQMINYEGLRFPSGIASAEMLTSLYSKSKDAMAKAYVLIAGIFAGGIVGILNTDDDTAAKVGFLKRFFEKTGIQIPGEVPDGGFAKIHGKAPQAFVFEPSLLLIGAGVITGMRVCLSMFAGSLLLYCVVGPALVQMDIDNSPASGWYYKTDIPVMEEVDGKPVPKMQKVNGQDVPVVREDWVYDVRRREESYRQNIDLNVNVTLNKQVVEADPAKGADDPKKPNKFAGAVLKYPTWSLWGGTAVMVFASLMSLALQWRTVGRAFSGFLKSPTGGASRESDAIQREMAEIEVPTKWMILGLIPIGIGLLVLQIIAFKIAWWAGLIAMAMSFFLSLVASRATGETDTTPIGAMGKVMQLMFAVFHPGQKIPNLASAGVAANSAIGSADLLTDLKSGYLLGASPRKQFLAQFFGVFFGTLAIVPIWYLMVPNQGELDKFPAPSTRQWEAVARVLTKGIDQLPDTAKYAILIGALVGIALPVFEKLTPARHRKYLPSAMGLGLSWVIPFSSSIGFMAGALIGWLWEVFHRKSATKFSIGAACGVIAGESLVKAILAMTATAIFLLTPPKAAEAPKADPPAAVSPGTDASPGAKPGDAPAETPKTPTPEAPK